MRTSRKLPTRSLGLFALLTGAFLFCYWGTLSGLWHLWSTDGDYSYAFFIPLVSAYAIWEQRRRLARIPIRAEWWGVLPFLTVMAMSLYGILGSSPSAVRPMLPLMLMVLTLWCGGRALLQALAFPLGLIFFMIPLPTMVQAKIGVPLKFVSTRLGELILKIAHVPVHVEGNIIDLGVTQLQVLDACSGLRYILPLFALGVIYAYFSERVRWKQLMLVLGTIPIAILMNGVRIGATGILTRHCGVTVAEGFFHGFSGWLVFLVAFALMAILHRILAVTPPRRPVPHPLCAGIVTLAGPAHSALRPAEPLLAAAVLLAAGVLVNATGALPGFTLKNGFTDFPLTLGAWQGTAAPLEPEMITASGADASLNALYTDARSRSVSVYAGYRGAPFNENENFFHSPNICLPSSGWKTDRIYPHTVSLRGPCAFLPVTVMEISNQDRRQVVYYWFQTRTRLARDININRFHLSLHALRRDNTHDLFVRLIAPVDAGETTAMAARRIEMFIPALLPALTTYVANHQQAQLS